MEKLDVEDGLYQAQAGTLRKLDVEDDGLKKIRVSPEAFEAVRAVQKQMRSRLGGAKAGSRPGRRSHADVRRNG